MNLFNSPLILTATAAKKYGAKGKHLTSLRTVLIKSPAVEKLVQLFSIFSISKNRSCSRIMPTIFPAAVTSRRRSFSLSMR